MNLVTATAPCQETSVFTGSFCPLGLPHLLLPPRSKGRSVTRPRLCTLVQTGGFHASWALGSRINLASEDLKRHSCRAGLRLDRAQGADGMKWCPRLCPPWCVVLLGDDVNKRGFRDGCSPEVRISLKFLCTSPNSLCASAGRCHQEVFRVRTRSLYKTRKGLAPDITLLMP